jgi:hypothetical protein
MWLFTALALGLVGSVGVTAAPPSGMPPPAPGEEQITADRLRRELTFLASPEFEGRESGSRGGRTTARYLSLQFKKAGLEPMGPAHLGLDAAAPSFYQPFNIIKYHWDTEGTTLRLSRSKPVQSVRTYKMFTDFIPWEYSGDVEVSAPVVFAGYGITAPEIDYDDYARLDVRGKLVLVFAHEPEETQEDSRWGGRGHTREAATDFKARNAQAHGAAGILVMPEPRLEHLDLWDVARGWFKSMGTMEQQALEDPYVRIPVLYVKPHVGRELFRVADRDPGEVQHMIESRKRPQTFSIPDISLTVSLRAKDVEPDVTANVIGLLEGSDPDLRDEVVILSAHYDHEGVSDGTVYAGADDDGSGTVSVLEIARAMAAAESRPRRSVLFAAWGAEEKGLFGSEVYASRPFLPLAKTVVLIQLDMVGRNEAPIHANQDVLFRDRDTRNSVNLLGTAYSPEFRKLISELNNGLDLEIDYKFDRDIEQSLFTRSDQWPFAIRNVPSLFFFTGLHPDYHSPSDRPIKINYGKMEKIARLAYRAAWSLANAEDRPKFSPIPIPADE